MENKKTRVFYFFPRNSLWATHSIFFETLYFCKTKSCLACFFFGFFFSLEKFTFTHSLDWKTRFFVFRGPKKSGFLHTYSIFAEKPQKTNYSLEKEIRYLWLNIRNNCSAVSSSTSVRRLQGKKRVFHSHFLCPSAFDDLRSLTLDLYLLLDCAFTSGRVFFFPVP